MRAQASEKKAEVFCYAKSGTTSTRLKPHGRINVNGNASSSARALELTEKTINLVPKTITFIIFKLVQKAH